MQNIISLDTEKLARRGFQHEGPPPPPHTHTHWRNTGGAGSPAPPVPTPMNVSKHLTDWSGVSTVELCGWKKRNLGGILRYVRPQKWGGGDLLPPPLPGKWGGERPPCPPCSYAYALTCPSASDKLAQDSGLSQKWISNRKDQERSQKMCSHPFPWTVS